MTCADCRDLLPLHAYGDLSDADRVHVDAHLAACAACRAEAAAFATTRSALDAPPVPAVAVDLNRIYRSEANRQRRAARRWRVAALFALAAGVLILAFRLDIRIDARQLTIRWGKVEPTPQPAPLPAHAPVVVRTEFVSSPELDERLNVLTALIHALAKTVDDGDRDRAAEVARLQREVGRLQRQGDQRWDETERTVSAAYAAQFGSKTQGDKP